MRRAGLSLVRLARGGGLGGRRGESALRGFAASCGVIQFSIGPSAARQTLPWWPPSGMITNGTFATRVSQQLPEVLPRRRHRSLSCAPAASQNAGSTSLTGTLVT